MKIGTTIRGHRLQKGLSQGDIEKRTGLLRCYLSRVENGHTVPSLDTLAKIAQALDLPLAQFFAEDSLGRELNPQKLTDDELRFLTQIRRYSTTLGALRQARIDHSQHEHHITTGRLPFDDEEPVLVIADWRYIGQGLTPGDALLAADARQVRVLDLATECRAIFR